MLYGIIAAEDLDPPVDPRLGIADFVNGIYSWQGSTLTASQIVTTVAGRITASGLYIPMSTANGVVPIIGDFASKLFTANWGMVLEIEITDGNMGTILSLEDTGNWFAIERDIDDGWTLTAEIPGVPNPNRTCNFPTSAANGVHKLAVNVTDDFIGISVDGNSAASDSDAMTPLSGLIQVAFGGWTGYSSDSGSFYVRSMTLYDSIALDQLQSMSS